MQTTGACLFAFNQCSSRRVQMHAEDSRSAHGLLYPAAVQHDGREQEHRQVPVDTNPRDLFFTRLVWEVLADAFNARVLMISHDSISAVR